MQNHLANVTSAIGSVQQVIQQFQGNRTQKSKVLQKITRFSFKRIRGKMMRAEIMEFIKADEDLSRYIREQPYWYRKLTRNPEEKEAFELAAMQHFKKRYQIKWKSFKINWPLLRS